MKLFRYEVHLVSECDNSYNRVKGAVMANSIIGAMNKLNEYYDDDDTTIVVVNLGEEKHAVCELFYEELQVEQKVNL